MTRAGRLLEGKPCRSCESPSLPALLLIAAVFCQCYSVSALAGQQEWLFLVTHLSGAGFCWLGLRRRAALRGLGLLLTAFVPGLSALCLLGWSLLPNPAEFNGSLALEPLPPPDRSVLGREALRLECLRLEASLDGSQHDVASLRGLDDSVQLSAKVKRLRNVLNNPQSRAYHLAKSQWARLQETYTRRLSQLTDSLRSLRADERLPVLQELARLEWDFAVSGLLEEGMASFYQDQAQARLAELMVRDPDNPKWALDRIDIFLARGRYAEAWEEVRQSLLSFPDQADLHLRRLMIRYQACQRVTPAPVQELLNTAWELRQKSDLIASLEPKLRESAVYWLEVRPC